MKVREIFSRTWDCESAGMWDTRHEKKGNWNRLSSRICIFKKMTKYKRYKVHFGGCGDKGANLG
jgi:hypothetical protein